MATRITPKFLGKLPSTDDFKKYIQVKLAGVINMNDIAKVREMTDLQPAKILYIREHYDQLVEKHKKLITLYQHRHEKEIIN